MAGIEAGSGQDRISGGATRVVFRAATGARDKWAWIRADREGLEEYLEIDACASKVGRATTGYFPGIFETRV